MRTGCNPQAGQDAGRTAAPKRPASLPRSRSRSPHSPLPRVGEAAPAVSEASADMAAPAYSPAGMQAGTVPGAEAAGRDSAVTAGRYLPVVYTSSRRWLCSCSLDSYHHSSKRMVFFRLQLRYAALPEIVRWRSRSCFLDTIRLSWRKQSCWKCGCHGTKIHLRAACRLAGAPPCVFHCRRGYPGGCGDACRCHADADRAGRNRG